jgi:hypothetical protein
LAPKRRPCPKGPSVGKPPKVRSGLVYERLDHRREPQLGRGAWEPAKTAIYPWWFEGVDFKDGCECCSSPSS